MIEIYMCYSFLSLSNLFHLLQKYYESNCRFSPMFSTDETENERKNAQTKYLNECNEFHTQRSHD